MKILNFNNQNAEELAKDMIACNLEFKKSECKEASFAEKARFVLKKWENDNPEAFRDPEKRKILTKIVVFKLD